jgi:hypothetical protein
MMNDDKDVRWDNSPRDIIKDILTTADKIRNWQPQKSMFMSIEEFDFYLANKIHIPSYAVIYILNQKQ